MNVGLRWMYCNNKSLLSFTFALAAASALIATSLPLHSQEFQIKSVIMRGEAAPSGGVFGLIGDVSINNFGAIAFIAGAGPGIGVYLANEESLTTVVRDSVNFSFRVFLNDTGAMVFDRGSFSNPVLFSFSTAAHSRPEWRQISKDRVAYCNRSHKHRYCRPESVHHREFHF